jgi:amino acid adenylation domain-containing protein
MSKNMSKIEDFLAELRRHNIELWLEGADLRYRAPKDAFTPDLMSQLKERKSEVVKFFQQIQQAKSSTSSNLNPIQAVSRDQHLPLSFAQQRLWLIDQITENNFVYNVPLAYRITGELDIEIFSQCLNAIAQRHESLRTTFTVIDQQPVQNFVANLEIDLPIIDLRSLTVNEQQQELSGITEIESKTPFELSQSPLLRAKLVCLAPDDHVFFLTMHHIICDGWSLDIFFRELSLMYEAFVAGQPSPLPRLSIQYADFALWQREWLQGEVLNTQLSYWTEQLRDINPLLQLATDRPRPTVQSNAGDRQIFYLSKSLSDSLKALSNSEGVTLFMVLLAAFQTLLYRYTGQTDILVGCPIANRNRAEIENLIGFFVNTLALRANFTDNLTFRGLLNQTKKVTLEAYAHQDLPFEKLVEELNLERDLSFNPIVQVTFALQTAPLLAIELSNLKLAPLKDVKNSVIKFDLEVNAWETREGLILDWGYNCDLFESATMMRMIQHYQTLLEGIVGDRHLPVNQISILTAAEQEQILKRWNATTTTYPQEKSIAAIFEEQVNLRGNAIAAKFGQTEISYAELNTKANHLAHYLQNKGIGFQELVGICVDQSVEMLIGLLGILKAGAAYVPLDKDYPDERLELMLADAGVRVVITQQQQAARFANHGHEIICLDHEWEEIAQTPKSLNNPTTQATGNSLAYVIYTSGSTGKPKGVEVLQNAIARLVINTNYIDIRIEDRIGQASNASFDAATFEIWGALLNGAMVVGIRKEIILTPELLAATILEEQISTLFLTTALFNQIARQKPETFAPLKNLLFGGEAVDVESVRIIMAKGKPARFLHVYGPTENTTFSTWYLIDQIAPNATSIPIGHAIANTQTYILDRQQQIVPVGVVGELYVGGDGLAKGYLHRPELNAEKFISNPYGRSPSERLYRTGDLAKYAIDGNIEFVGRIDFQVKIRGFRIEIGEVEAAIARHDHVQDLIVIAKDDPLGNKSLIAYVVAKPETALIVSQLRNFLKENLPDYMIPAAFVILDKLPLTPNGKVDKNALPSPEDLRSQVADDYVMPQTEVERLIAAVWQEVLQISNVGIYDNFFEIGGNSLLLVQAYSKFQNLFGSQVSMVILFRYPNIHALAEHLSQSQSTEVSEPNRAENRKSRQDLIKQQRQNRLKSRLPNNPN